MNCQRDKTMYIFKSMQDAETELINSFDGCSENISDLRKLLTELEDKKIAKRNGTTYILDVYDILG